MTGVKRQVINFKRLAVTPIKIKIGRDAREKSLKSAWEKQGVLAKYNATAAAKR